MITLVEVTDSRRALEVAKRQWRLLAREMSEARLLDPDRISPVTFSLMSPVTADEAKAIGSYFANLLDHAELPIEIDLDLAERFAHFASASLGFQTI